MSQDLITYTNLGAKLSDLGKCPTYPQLYTEEPSDILHRSLHGLEILLSDVDSEGAIHDTLEVC